MRPYRLILTVIMGLLALSACNVTRPTVTPASLPLDNVFSGTNVLGGTAEVRYPAGWFLSGEVDTGLQFANQESMLQTRPEMLTGDQIFGGLVVVPAQLAGSFSGGQAATPITIMQSFLNVFTSDDVTLSAPIELTLGERSAAQISGTSSNGDVFFITVDSGNAFFILFAATATGRMAQVQSTLTEIAARATYTP